MEEEMSDDGAHDVIDDAVENDAATSYLRVSNHRWSRSTKHRARTYD